MTRRFATADRPGPSLLIAPARSVLPHRPLAGGLAALLAVAALAGCSASGAAPTPTPGRMPAAAAAGAAERLPREVSVKTAAAMQGDGAFVLDVREPAEWNAGHIEGATLIPLGQLASRTSEVPRDREVVVVCRSGNRSAQGRDILLAAGLPSVTSMAGGMNDWAASGLPVVTGP